MRQKSCFWAFRHTSLLVIFACLYFFPLSVLANTGLSISPLIIDHTSEGRDIISETITLRNQSDRPLRLYASVHGISLSGAGEIEEFVSPAMSDRSQTLTSWIEISRGRLEVPPQGELQVPLTIRVNHNAQPGSYHGFIGFAMGRNRDIAEETVLRGASQGVIIRVSINEQRHEQLQLVGYTTERFAALGGNQSVRFTLRNTGDTPLTPRGEIIIYDNRGREVDTLEVALTEELIPAGGEYVFSAELPPIAGFGRHKAYLTVDYGAKRASVHDTTFFITVPWLMVLLFCGAILLMLIALFMLARPRPQVAYNNEVSEVGFLVRPRKSHTTYDHDLNLKKDR